METRQQFSLWYLLAAVTAMLILQSFISPSDVETLPYSDFKVLLKAGKLKNITLGEGAITGTLNTDGIENLLPKPQADAMQHQGKGEHAFSTIRVNDPALVQQLTAAKVRFVG
ncbi:MAG: ATP-dependent metallopeptidase FtsH/Yme1/Tma family protein, partial [Pandoraea sp.]|nr:ATP-dependent metallopeptidase FtsH/Yme1/Tma family protein [Pandoraea sp.]